MAAFCGYRFMSSLWFLSVDWLIIYFTSRINPLRIVNNNVVYNSNKITIVNYNNKL